MIFQFNINPSIFAFPVNLLVGFIIIYIAFRDYQRGKKSGKAGKLSSIKYSIIASILVIFVAFIYGIGILPTSLDFTSSWIFVGVIIWFLIVLSAVLIRRIATTKLFNIQNITFLLSHFGLWLAVMAGLFGNADQQNMRMIINKSGFINTCYSEKREAITLPFSVVLNKFEVEYYDTGDPSRYCASITINEDNSFIKDKIEINHPIRYGKYDIYLQSYDSSKGNETSYCLLQIVKQPWKWLIFSGIILMILGALLSFIKLGKWKFSGWIIFFFILGLLIYMIFIFASMKLHSKPLIPALQSKWFIPHITMYMFSYALLGCAFVITIIGLIKKNYNPLSTLDSLILIGISFFTIGMLFGALWAKEAWGDYWTWDPKETWSAVTWLGFLTYLHLRRGIKIRKKLLYLVVILSFLALQMCWYGINYLPNAKESVHTYSRE